MPDDDGPRFTGRPLFNKLIFNYERGTCIRAEVESGVVEGRVIQNQPTNLELQDAKIITGTGVTLEPFYRLNASDVNKIEIISKNKVKARVPDEICHSTVVVSTKESFNRLVKMLQSQDVTEVGMNLYGVYVGRFGSVGWVTLFVQDVLFCIDVLKLQALVPDFWPTLARVLFCNAGIRKVVYNSRPIVDFMFHKHGITPLNMDDLQVTDAYMRVNKDLTLLLHHAKKPTLLKYRSLSSMVAVMLKDVVPAKEIDLLKEFENEDVSMESPLMKRPIQDKKFCKYVAVDMKYLILLRNKLQSELLQRLNQCINKQMEDCVDANNGVNEHQMKYPEKIPAKVFKHLVPGLKNNSISIVKGANTNRKTHC